MNNPSIFTTGQGNKRIKFPYLGTVTGRIRISTRKGTVVVVLPDGSKVEYTPQKNFDLATGNGTGAPLQFDYVTAFTGDAILIARAGTKDVYSLKIEKNNAAGIDRTTSDKLNILDFGSFIKQFPKLYSIVISYYAQGIVNQQAVVKGDLSQVPNSLRNFYIENKDFKNGITDVYMNISNFDANSQLSFFNCAIQNTTNASFALRVLGDIAKLPNNISYFRINYVASNSSVTYTPGRVWRSNFNSFIFLTFTLSSIIIDNILIDLANSVTSAVGGKLIQMKGTRTSASDSAVTYLQGLGFTVTITA